MAKLKYAVPDVVSVREEPAVDKGPLPPVEFVKHWIAMFGDFKDGKLEKAKVMKPKDLSVEDAKYLIDAGIALEKIAAQYRFTSFDEFKAGLEKHGLIKQKISPKAENEIWFSENQSIGANSLDDPVVRISKGGIAFNSKFSQLIDNVQYVHIGVTSDNQIKIKPAENGLKVQVNKKGVKAKRVSCAAVKNLLIKQGVKIPAIFDMVFDEVNQYWVGKIEHEN